LVVYNLSSAGPLLSPSLSLSSSGRPPFIDQGVRIHWTLGPDKWAQRTVQHTVQSTQTTTVVTNLSSDMLPCLADSLMKGGLLLSRQQGDRWGNVACGVTCGGYYVGVIMGEAEPSYPSVMADCQARRGRRQQLHYLGNTRSIVPPGQRIASASATSMRTSSCRNECSGR